MEIILIRNLFIGALSLIDTDKILEIQNHKMEIHKI